MKTYVLVIIILSFITFSCTNNFSNGEEFMKQSKYEEAVDAFSLVPENDENFKKSQYLSKISENYIIITKIKKLDIKYMKAFTELLFKFSILSININLGLLLKLDLLVYVIISLI